VADTVTVSAGSTVEVDIQPPPGETWLIEIALALTNVDGKQQVWYKDYDGSTYHTHVASYIGENYGYGECFPHLAVSRVLTNTLYARIGFKNQSPSGYAGAGTYGYSGFKLSKPLWSPRRLSSNPDPKPWKRKPTAFKIPPEVEALADHIADIYDYERGGYRQAIILEENTPLAVDPKTNFPVERLTAYCFVDDFINAVLKPLKAGTLNLERSGWRKYLARWVREGVKLPMPEDITIKLLEVEEHIL